MAAFPPNVTEAQITDFTIKALKKIDKRYKDVVSTPSPVWTMYEKRKAGGVKHEAPGQGPVRRIYYNTPDRGLELSRSQPQGTRTLEKHDSFTEAQYEWGMRLDTLTVPYYDYKNLNSPEGYVKYLEMKRVGINRAHRNAKNNWLWNGRTIGSNKLFGLKDAIRFVPTSDPSRGSIGGIGVADLSVWANRSKNYNDYALTYATGANTKTFLSYGANCLYRLYSDCGYNIDQEDAESEAYPDLIVANQAYMQACTMLAESKLLMRDANDTYKMGVDSFVYRGSRIVEDRNIPDDPNNSAYGVAFLLNTNVVEPVITEGIDDDWDQLSNHPDNTVVFVDKVSQWTIAYRALDRLGVHYGVNPAVTAS